MRSSKALEALDQIPDEEFERPEASGPMQIDDRALTRAITLVAEAIAEASAKPEEPEPDYTKALGAIAAGLGGMASIRAEIAGLRDDISALTRAIGQIKPTDMAPICEAIQSVVVAQKSLSSAMTAPRVLTFDKNGEPTGLRIERVN